MVYFDEQYLTNDKNSWRTMARIETDCDMDFGKSAAMSVF